MKAGDYLFLHYSHDAKKAKIIKIKDDSTDATVFRYGDAEGMPFAIEAFDDDTIFLAYSYDDSPYLLC